MVIRTATTKDASAILEIYTPYVQETAITFEYEVPSLEEFTQRIAHTLEKYPYLVAEEDSKLLGYAYASSFKTRAAYSWSVETSIYVEWNSRGQHVGTALYAALEDLLRCQNICNLCACIAYPNPVSETFHHLRGYETVAHFHHSGYKSGEWWDMIWMEKALCPCEIPPKPFIPFPLISSTTHPKC